MFLKDTSNFEELTIFKTEMNTLRSVESESELTLFPHDRCICTQLTILALSVCRVTG